MTRHFKIQVTEPGGSRPSNGYTPPAAPRQSSIPFRMHKRGGSSSHEVPFDGPNGGVGEVNKAASVGKPVQQRNRNNHGDMGSNAKSVTT